MWAPSCHQHIIVQVDFSLIILCLFHHFNDSCSSTNKLGACMTLMRSLSTSPQCKYFQVPPPFASNCSTLFPEMHIVVCSNLTLIDSSFFTAHLARDATLRKAPNNSTALTNDFDVPQHNQDHCNCSP